MTNSTKNISVDEWQEVWGSDQFQVPWSNPVQKWHQISRSRNQDCLSNDQTKQNLVVQYHQLRKQVKALQVSCHLHPPPWLWSMDPACWLWKKDPGFRSQVHRELLCISYLEHKTNDWAQSKINFIVGLREPLLATVKKWKLVWFGHVIKQPLQNHPSRHLGGWGIYFILAAYTGTGVSQSQHRKEIRGGFGKNAGEWTRR